MGSAIHTLRAGNVFKKAFLGAHFHFLSLLHMNFILKSGLFLPFCGQKLNFCNKNVFFLKNYAIFIYVNVSEGSFGLFALGKRCKI